jgi:RNA polymerase sigma-70 factor (ECF subfamily)
MVLSAAGGASPAAREALDQLCRAYWFPLYAFARRTGRSPADAQDVTQGFFAHLLEKELLGRADPQVGRFRSFVLGSFKHFLAHDYERTTALKRGGGQIPVSLDQLEPEERYSLGAAIEASPESSFDREWAEEQLDHALARLRDDYSNSGRAGLFDLLKDYVWGDKNALTLAEIALRLDLTEEALKKAVQRLRSRFRECLRAEIAQTVATPDQIDEELRHLRAALCA